MSNVSDATKKLFDETAKCIVLGFTGRTGSGCSTAAKVLSLPKQKIPIPYKSNIYKYRDEARKYQIIQTYIKTNWKPFTRIQITSIITSKLLERKYSEFVELMASISEDFNHDDITQILGDQFNTKYDEAHDIINSETKNSDIYIIYILKNYLKLINI